MKVMKSGIMEYEEVDLPTVDPNGFCPYLICHLIISNVYCSTSRHIHFIYNKIVNVGVTRVDFFFSIITIFTLFSKSEGFTDNVTWLRLIN